jgi:hypothetical protein
MIISWEDFSSRPLAQSSRYFALFVCISMATLLCVHGPIVVIAFCKIKPSKPQKNSPLEVMILYPQ